MLAGHATRRVQAAVLVVAAVMAGLEFTRWNDETVALLMTKLGGLLAGTVLTAWVLGREGRAPSPTEDRAGD